METKYGGLTNVEDLVPCRLNGFLYGEEMRKGLYSFFNWLKQDKGYFILLQN